MVRSTWKKYYFLLTPPSITCQYGPPIWSALTKLAFHNLFQIKQMMKGFAKILMKYLQYFHIHMSSLRWEGSGILTLT